MKDRQFPASALNVGKIVDERPHVVMPATVAESEIKDRSLAERANIENRLGHAFPLVNDERWRFSFELAMKKRLDWCDSPRQIEFVSGFELLDPACQGMVRVGDFDHVWTDWRVSDERSAQRIHEKGGPVRSLDLSILKEVQNRIRTVKGEPTSAVQDIITQHPLGLPVGHDVARVSDEEVGLSDRFDIAVILEDTHAHALVLGQKLQQLGPSEIHVVPLSAHDQHDIDRPSVLQSSPLL